MDNDNFSKTASRWELLRPTKRRIIQLYSALLYNAHLRGFAEGKIFTGKAKGLCAPGFNCYSCPGATLACPIGALQNALGSLNKNVGFYVFGIIMLYGMLLGRTVCGWLCPVGMLQELLYKIPAPKLKKSRFTRALSYLKYVILLVFVAIIPIYYGLLKGMQVPAFCKYICPAGTFEGAMGMIPGNLPFLSMLGAFFTGKFVIMVIVILACIFCYRSFCRFLCPLGAIYGFFNKLSIVGVKVDVGGCINCGACVRNCKMDVKYVGDHECIHCGQCIQHCPKSVITLKAGQKVLVGKTKGQGTVPDRSSRTRERIVYILAGVILGAALIWFNFFDPSVRAEDPEAQNISVTETGYEVGEVLRDFEATCMDGSVFKLSENRGKVVVINLWATYCGPCVKEMPYIVEFTHEHEGDVTSIAVHPNLVTEDVGEYLSGRDWDILFTIDDDDETIFKTVNGSLALPQTIVINRSGKVVYNQVGSISKELLESLYEKAK